MKQLFAIVGAIFFCSTLAAQEDIRVKRDTVPGKAIRQQKVVTIILKGDQAADQKQVIEIEGDKIKINGKDAADVKDVSVNVGKSRMLFSSAPRFRALTSPRFNQSFGGEDVNKIIIDGKEVDMEGLRKMTENKAFLGIGMEKTDEGIRINDITKESAAEKAGLKEGDVIVRLDGKKMETQMDVTNTISSHKPGDAIDIVYKRDGKEKTVKATLGKKSGLDMGFGNFSWSNDDNNISIFKLSPGEMPLVETPDFKFDMQTTPGNGIHLFKDGQHDLFNGFSSASPRLGVIVKETESGKGLSVTEVDAESVAAKAGLKEGDIITEVGGKAVNTVEEIREAVKGNKDKAFTVKYTRDGKAMSAEIKFPKPLKQTGL
jgi:serine protease Do